MQKPKPQPKQKVSTQAVESVLPKQIQGASIQFGVQQQQQLFQGPIPHPDVLKGYEALMPGLADRIVKMAEEQAKHRQAQEAKALEANISAQNRNLGIADYQTKSVFRSDLVGQACGTLVSLCCIAGATFLALSGHEKAAIALGAIPTAAVIRAFFVQRGTGTQKPKAPQGK